jgi:hypothetical protein
VWNVGRVLVVLSVLSVGLTPMLMASCGNKNNNMGRYMTASRAISVEMEGHHKRLAADPLVS